jgi:2-hydroxychromene-2-carboxylate isomerase
MEPIKVEFMFDFGSPNAYLAEKVIPEIERRTGVRFEYVPVLLGGIFKLTNNRSPGELLVGIKNKPEFMELEIQRFIRRHNITTFRKNPFFPVNTLQLMRGAVAAQFEGVFKPYFHAAYHHMWEEPKKMDDPQVARAAFISSNIDFDRLFARSQQADVKARLLEHAGRGTAEGTPLLEKRTCAREFRWGRRDPPPSAQARHAPSSCEPSSRATACHAAH